LITDGTGTIVSTNASGTPHSVIGNTWLYTGQQFDEESGLYFYRVRFYKSDLGRFVQRDPLHRRSAMNLYQYVAGNPVNMDDPFGLKERKIVVSFIDDYVTFTAYLYWAAKSDYEVIPVFSSDFDPDDMSGNWAESAISFGLGDSGRRIMKASAKALVAANGKVPDDKAVATMVGKILGKLEKDDCIKTLDTTGHGKSGGWVGRLSVGDIKDSYKGPIKPNVEALLILRGKWCKDAKMTMRMCETANGQDGEDFIGMLAMNLGVRVTGWTGVYAGVPTGDRVTAWPTKGGYGGSRVYNKAGLVGDE